MSAEGVEAAGGEVLAWGDMAYDSMTPAEVVHDYAKERGDLSEQYARDQLASWIERYAYARATCEHGVSVAELCADNDRLIAEVFVRDRDTRTVRDPAED